MEMKKYKLGEIAQICTITITPQSGTIYNLYSLPSFDDRKRCEIIDGQEIQSNKFSVPDRCILFNKLNVRFKRIWCVNNSDSNKICSTEFLPLIINEEIVDFNYFYYLLNSDCITDYLCGQNTNTSGSHKRIDPHDLLQIEVFLPTLSYQKAIGKILSDFDRKIELNRAINHNLPTLDRSLAEAIIRLVA